MTDRGSNLQIPSVALDIGQNRVAKWPFAAAFPSVAHFAFFPNEFDLPGLSKPDKFPVGFPAEFHLYDLCVLSGLEPSIGSSRETLCDNHGGNWEWPINWNLTP